jgi:hypothetical protein
MRRTDVARAVPVGGVDAAGAGPGGGPAAVAKGQRLASVLPGGGLVDLEVDAAGFTPVPGHAGVGAVVRGPAGHRERVGRPGRPRPGARHDLVRERACCRPRTDRPPQHAYALDGRHVRDVPALYLALGEAVNGPGGYSAAGTLLWRDASTVRWHVSGMLTPVGPTTFRRKPSACRPGAGMDVTPA